MDEDIRKLNTKIHNKETEFNALFTKIQKLEEVIATVNHKKLETVELSLTGVLGMIFEVAEEEEKE